MNKKELIKTGVIILGVIILVIIIKLLQNMDTTKSDLKKKGYNKEEIVLILEKLNEENINKVLNLEYNSKLVDIITSKYYIDYNLERYLAYSDKTDNISDIISIVNVKADNNWYTNTVETDLEYSNLILVNKFYYLNEDYHPDDIVAIKNWYAYEGHTIKKDVYDAYVRMWNKANSEGLLLLVNSSYRTFEDQQEQYDLADDDYAARPGYSEHQTGLALDIVTNNTIGNDFENTDEFKWLQKNAHKYGFILRYPKDKDYLTGYAYESWHYRYLGVEMATKVYESGLTYDEYFAYFCEYKGEC